MMTGSIVDFRPIAIPCFDEVRNRHRFHLAILAKPPV
jgi:hypothetical protein